MTEIQILQILLLDNTHSHPLLYLNGINEKELLCILQYLYLGETNVPMEQFETFMEIAKDLQIKELGDGDAIDKIDLKDISNFLAQAKP